MTEKKMHSIRIREDAWASAVRRAEAEGVTMTAVIEKALERYGKGLGLPPVPVNRRPGTVGNPSKAEAWEEGYDAGVPDLRDENLERVARNPYREES